MKSIKFFLLTALALCLFMTSCKKDNAYYFDNEPELENCDNQGCDNRSCATEVTVDSKIVCSIEGSGDEDWYAVEISQDQVDTNSGYYTFNFINHSDDLILKIDLFSSGVASGDVNISGVSLLYEPNTDTYGVIKFFEPGTYYLKVGRASGQSGDGIYEVRVFL